jgi:hypothetical protein
MIVGSGGARMRQTKPCLFRHATDRYFAVGTLAVVVTLGLFGCEYDDSDWEIDQESGATSSRGGTKGSSGGSGNRSGSSNVSGGEMGGAGDLPADYPPPTIDSMEPTSGPYGTLVTIKGSGLGHEGLPGFKLALGSEGNAFLTPENKGMVMTWTDEEITFRFPFPSEGAVVLEGPKGDVVAGDFTPSWHIAQKLELPPAASVIASISPQPDHIAMLFDTMPLTLLDLGPEGIVEHAVTADGVETTSLRLYLNATGKIEAVGVSADADPVIVHLQNQADDFVAVPTAIKLTATEYVVAGGSEGAAVWMRRAAGWQRARPSAATWKVDKGPIADPDPDAPDHTSGASSDGSLYIAQSVDTGSFFDDMEAPYMQRLEPTASAFGGSMKAGNSVDDYITSLELKSSGDGLVVRVCGSDVDPFGLSGTDRYCYDSLHTASGAQLSGVAVDAKASAHAFTHERAVAAHCGSEGTWMIRTDLPDSDEIILFPCPEAVALEVDGDGDYLPVVRYSGSTYLLERNPAAVSEGGAGGAGAGGAAGAAGAGGAP